MRNPTTISPTRLFLGAGALVLAAAVGATAATAGAFAPTSSAGAPAVAASGSANSALGPTAADLALAANTSTANVAAARVAGRGGFVGRLLRRSERIEFTIPTATGNRTILYVRGQITSLSATSITMTLKDGSTQSYTIDSTTKVREKGKAEQASALTTTERAIVLGVKNADGSYTAKLIRVVVPATTAPATAAPTN